MIVFLKMYLNILPLLAVAVYSLQVFSEVLKLLRKKSDGNTTSMTLGSIGMCFMVHNTLMNAASLRKPHAVI